MNNMYEYLLNKNTAMQKQASAPMVPACSRNVYNVLRKVAAEVKTDADLDDAAKKELALRAALADPGFLEKLKAIVGEGWDKTKTIANDSWDWTKAHGEDLGYIGGGLGLGAGAGALLTPKNRILGALLGGVLGAGGGYGTKLLVNQYGGALKDLFTNTKKKEAPKK